MTSDQNTWWTPAPLGPDGRRDLTTLGQRALRGLLDASRALARHAIRAQRGGLRELLGEQEDLDQQLATWILEAAATYDPERGTWTGHLVQRVRQQAADHWRRTVGWSAIELLRRANHAGEHELSRDQRLHLKRIRSLMPGGAHGLDERTAHPPVIEDAYTGIEEHAERAHVTRELLRAGYDPAIGRPELRRALVYYLLSHLGGHPQRRVAAACAVHHRTLAALSTQLHDHLRVTLRPTP
ncbi:hypothetical protein JOF53_006458 [Crossiella equi]|uniref:RNA polymerase sigma-70 region 2 domain-containing protein n=1 Tax=Crossiella equi TaxID=130796 RepID=A0ABS5AM00_9PSEU|nr:hypothetical protein [Crossiella equi]MBP2477586.1 hypothetical protein [Crossiella equi]